MATAARKPKQSEPAASESPVALLLKFALASNLMRDLKMEEEEESRALRRALLGLIWLV